MKYYLNQSWSGSMTHMCVNILECVKQGFAHRFINTKSIQCEASMHLHYICLSAKTGCNASIFTIFWSIVFIKMFHLATGTRAMRLSHYVKILVQQDFDIDKAKLIRHWYRKKTLCNTGLYYLQIILGNGLLYTIFSVNYQCHRTPVAVYNRF